MGKLTAKYEEVDYSVVLYHLADGKYDNVLDALSNAVFSRKKQLQQIKAAENLATLLPGDQVRIVGAIKPKYLQGQLAIVLDINDLPEFVAIPPVGNIPIDFGRPIRRYGRYCSVPAQLVKKVKG